MQEIRSLKDTGLEELYAAFSEAFHDYERTFDRSEFEKMIQRRGYDPELSFAAFDGGQLVSFILNGTGMFNGLSTVYDTGTGTVVSHRGQGLVTKIFQASLPYLRERGHKQYLLEVLQNNTKAVSIYEKNGFRVSREFSYFIQATDEINLNNKILPDSYELRETDLSQKASMKEMWDFEPAWQNNFSAIERKINDFRIMAAYKDGELIGYGIMEPSAGDISQIAVAAMHRRKGIGSAILKALVELNDFKSIKLINTETYYEPMNSFVASNGIPLKGKQFEMLRGLDG